MDQPARHEADTAGGEFRMIDIVLPAVPRSPSVARHAVADFLDRSGAVPTGVVEDVLLLVSELVTNSVQHAGTDTRVSAWARDGRVLIEVSDDDPHHAPFLAERGSGATDGRGVMLVDALASDWGINVTDSSKVVWFEASYEADGLALRKVGRLERRRVRVRPG